MGVARAAKQLGLHESQFYAWRKQSEHTLDVSEREVNLATENARLKRQLAQQAEELSILKNAAVTGESMRQAVFEYIETDYNPVRLHSFNSFQSPIEFEANFKQSLAS